MPQSQVTPETISNTHKLLRIRLTLKSQGSQNFSLSGLDCLLAGLPIHCFLLCSLELASCLIWEEILRCPHHLTLMPFLKFTT